MGYPFWEMLAHEIEHIEEGKEIARVRARSRARARASGSPTQLYTRDTRVNVSVYPWTNHELRELAVIRGTTAAGLSSLILEQVAGAWVAKSPHEEALGLYVTPEPAKADVWIEPQPDVTAVVGKMGIRDNAALRGFGVNAMRLIWEGISVEELKEELENIYEALQ
jgi:hypothetical protein